MKYSTFHNYPKIGRFKLTLIHHALWLFGFVAFITFVTLFASITFFKFVTLFASITFVAFITLVAFVGFIRLAGRSVA